MGPREVICSYKINREIGRLLSETREGPRHSEVGVRKERSRVRAGLQRLGDRTRRGAAQSAGAARQAALHFDPFVDLEHYADTLLQQERLGIFTIGGGVPRNWAQQFGPFIELRHRRGGEDLPLKRFHYGVRICPEPVNWGGLSGSPYSEAMSWGKFVPPEEGGRFGEVLLDATVGLPIMCAAVWSAWASYKKASFKIKD